MSTEELESTSGSQAFETILENALKIPGVKVNRNAFLSEAFQTLPPEKLNEVLLKGPVLAGNSQSQLDKIASSTIMKRTLQSSGVSFAAGLPGGLAMAATIPADTMQFFCMALRLAQEVSYLYGADDLWRNGELADEEMIGQFILYCGVMFGVSGSSAAVRVLSSTMAKQVAKKLPQKALTKTIYYPIIKKVATLLGVKMTKDTFAKGISKAIPVIGGVVSGGITYVSMRPMGNRLAKTLSEANFNYTETQAEKDIIQLYQQGEQGHFSAENGTPPQTEVQNTGTTDGGEADALIKYRKLRDAGAITQEEFDLLKQKLIHGEKQ